MHVCGGKLWMQAAQLSQQLSACSIQREKKKKKTITANIYIHKGERGENAVLLRVPNRIGMCVEYVRIR